MQTEARPTRADCLAPTVFIDSDSPAIARFVGEALAGFEGEGDRAKAVRLFEAVRDGLRYDPYSVTFDPDDYRASAVLQRSSAFCVPKAILLAACLRRAGIPAAVGFADVRNHLNSPKLAELMGTDVFHYHGYVQLWFGDESCKVTPAFNMELCERFGVMPLIFDGHSDALFHEADASGRRYMEYVRDRGLYPDVPVAEILDDFSRTYPKLRDLSLSAARMCDPSFHGLRRLEDFSVGQSFECRIGPLSAGQIRNLARQWNREPLHPDAAYAAERHGGPVAPCLLTLLEGMPPAVREVFCQCDNLGGLGVDDLRWRAPVRVGEVLKVRLEITGLRASPGQPGRGATTYRLEARNRADEVAFHLNGAVMIRRRGA